MNAAYGAGSVLTRIFNLVFMPFERISPWYGLIAISAVSGVALIWLFKLTSNQPAIRAVRERISGGFLEIRLFGDDPAVMTRALGGVLLANLKYLRYSLVPLIFMIVPMVAVLVHANQRYGVRPALPREKVMLVVKLRENASDSLYKVNLMLPEGVEMAAPAVRIPETREAAWMLKATAPGDYPIKFRGAGDMIKHQLVCGRGVPGIRPVRTGAGAVDVLLNPGPPPIPAGSAIESVTIKYPPRKISAAGTPINWLVIFFIASLVFGFSVKGLLKVEI